jgi:polar amino acid transport system substrate-binding protein
MRPVFVLAALSLVLIAAGCGSSGSSSTTSTTTGSTTTGAAGSAASLVPAAIKSKGTLTLATDLDPGRVHFFYYSAGAMRPLGK